MSSQRNSSFGHPLGEVVRPLAGHARDYEPLVELARDARVVLIGEASHGTHEFYRERAEITKLLLQAGFHAVAVEADWPDAYRVNRYVHARGDDVTAEESLRGFRRFPAWMWRNADVVDFVRWLREFNDQLRNDTSMAGFYGLDLYSLHASMQAVVEYLERVDPNAARRARQRYACFDHVSDSGDGQRYGYATAFGHSEACEDEVIQQLVELRSRGAEYLRGNGSRAEDELFYAEQNARLVKAAEAYYRTMYWGNVSSWNVRDRHMARTLEALVEHLDRRVGRAKVVVWAHNSHVGDARATQMGEQGELNLGQLARERFGREALLVRLTTYTGSVTAASDWGGPAERKSVRRALDGSYELLFHDTGIARFLLLVGGTAALRELGERRLERAIGVIYRPETERSNHYFHARLADQFDAVLHVDETRAVEPLERTARWETGEPPETYPTAV